MWSKGGTWLAVNWHKKWNIVDSTWWHMLQLWLITKTQSNGKVELNFVFCHKICRVKKIFVSQGTKCSATRDLESVPYQGLRPKWGFNLLIAFLKLKNILLAFEFRVIEEVIKQSTAHYLLLTPIGEYTEKFQIWKEIFAWMILPIYT